MVLFEGFGDDFAFGGQSEFSRGAYRSVYTNLTNCPVEKGQTVDVGTFLGNVGGASGDNSVLHFEVWKVAGDERTPVDPRKWLTAK